MTKVLFPVQSSSHNMFVDYLLFLTNVLDEMSGKEVNVSCNKNGSKALERIVKDAPFERLVRFVEGLAPR